MDAEAWEKVQAESERLLEDLKKEVKTELKDIGVLRKELRITVPGKVITDHMEHNYSELMQDAFVPGFRKGHAPRRLIEKRYGAEVRESLTSSIVGQSYFAVLENEKLDVLGDPLFRVTDNGGVRLVDIDEALQHVKLPEQGDFAYTCEIELKPSFELPELKGIKIRAPEIEITDTMIDEQMLQRRKMRGRLEPIDEPAQKNDQVVAEVVLTVAGQEIKREDNQTFAVRPTSLDGIPLVDLDQALVGARAGESRTLKCRIPPDFERADLRGQDGEFTFRIHELKRLVPEELADFLKTWAFENEAEAREHHRAVLESERDRLIQRAKKAQVEEYLLNNVQLDLPQDFSARQTERAVLRRVIELEQRGVPLSDVEAHIDELRTSAHADVARELKLSFILDKVAEQLDVHVTDEEVNTEIAGIAQQYNRRFDRVRDDLQSRGLLTQLVEQIRHNKCIERLLEQAELTTEPVPTEPQTEQPAKAEAEAATGEEAEAKPKRKPKSRKSKAADPDASES